MNKEGVKRKEWFSKHKSSCERLEVARKHATWRHWKQLRGLELKKLGKKVRSPGTGEVSRSQRQPERIRTFAQRQRGTKGGFQARDQICNLHMYILLRSFR